jgi:ribosomal protein S17E
MTRQEQKNFVSLICKTISDEIVKNIDQNRMPESFDGHELRVLIADRFEENAKLSSIRREPRSKRARNCKNWYITEYMY